VSDESPDTPTLDDLEANQDARPGSAEPEYDRDTFETFGIKAKPGELDAADAELPEQPDEFGRAFAAALAEAYPDSEVAQRLHRGDQPEPEEDKPEEPLTAADAAAYLAGLDQAQSPEEQLILQNLAIEQGLRDGTIAEEAVRQQENWQTEAEQLLKDCPGIDSEECLAVLTPAWENLVDQLGEAAGQRPDVIRSLYEAAGGADRFGDSTPEKVADREREQYEKALTGHVTDPFGFTADAKG
jgi:hypothetical protein